MFYKNRQWETVGKPAFERQQAEELRKNYNALSHDEKVLYDVLDGVMVRFDDGKYFSLKFNFKTKRVDVENYGFGLFENMTPYKYSLRRHVAGLLRGTGVFVPWYI